MSKIPYKWLVAIGFVAGFFMDLMDTTIVNVALPALSKDLHVPDTTLEWVITGYLLSLAIWIPASGWIGDKFGTKRTFLFALGTFTIGSFLCSIAPNVDYLIFFRVLQGVGGGMMTPVGTTMLFRAFPPNQRAQASSVLAVPAALAPAIGPTLGGWLVDYVGWRWIFRINIPIGIAGFLFSWVYLREYKGENVGKFDLVGFLLSGVGLASILYSLSTVPTAGISSLPVIVSFVIGVALLGALVWIETRSRSPILDFTLLKERLFRTTNVVMFFAFAMWLGFLFVLPIYLEQQGGLSAFQAGLELSPQAIGWLVVSRVAENLYKKLGPKFMITVGLLGATLATLLFFFINPGVNPWIIRGALFVRGFSMGFAVIPVQAAAFANISIPDTGQASSLFNTNRQVASSFGVAIVGTVLFELFAINLFPKPLMDYHVSFIVSAVLGIIAVLFALRVKNKDAAASLSEDQPAGGGD